MSGREEPEPPKPETTYRYPGPETIRERREGPGCGPSPRTPGTTTDLVGKQYGPRVGRVLETIPRMDDVEKIDGTGNNSGGVTRVGRTQQRTALTDCLPFHSHNVRSPWFASVVSGPGTRSLSGLRSKGTPPPQPPSRRWSCCTSMSRPSRQARTPRPTGPTVLRPGTSRGGRTDFRSGHLRPHPRQP